MDFLKKTIQHYQPLNEQELADKLMMQEYIEMFPDVLTRANKVCHFTSSAFVVNETCDKVLMAYHNIFDSYAWLGGHLDGNENYLEVAEKEAMEESGITELKALTNSIVSLDILPVFGHYKNGSYVCAHQHLSIACLFVGNEQKLIRPKYDENSEVKWIPIKELKQHINEKEMIIVYEKIIVRLKEFNKNNFVDEYSCKKLK